jgi:protease-4
VHKFTKFLAFLGGIVLIWILVVVGVVIARNVSGKHVPGKTVLEVNLEGGLVEDIPDDPVAKALMKDKTVVRDVVDAIDRGGNDSRVVGLVARLGRRMGIAQAQEIREAVQRFRSKGKFTVAYAETFGEFQSAGNSYYLATAFDEIYMQPSGAVGLAGILLESPFAKNTLAKLGLQFRGDQRYEYKSAFDTFANSAMTPANREENQQIVNSWFDQQVKGIADGRHLQPEQVKALVDRGPFLAKEALDARLVDKLAYRDEVYDEVKKRAGAGSEMLYSDRYLDRAGRPHNKGKTIALIYGVGGVTRGKSSYDPLSGSASMGSDSVAAAFREAVDDKEVKAIIFRIDSPGGSYVASDTIWREVSKARERGKPVIATMGDLAGSGGYFVAMPADKIVAQPGTITASIGVFAGKVLSTGLWQKIGLNWGGVQAGANATIWTGLHDYSPAEWQRLQAGLDSIYADFTNKTAQGRHLPLEKVQQVAKGRIWTGADAKNLGLIDELGGFDEALKLAKKSANIPDSEEVRVRRYPRPKEIWELLLKPKPQNSEHDIEMEAVAEALKTIQPVAQTLRAVSGGAADDVLRMPLAPQPQ